ncbi:MAG: PD-(D/E)XK nuclease family protein [Firmicutes bacterium]|nr:PD-(D/E)XK nuclease family protein [Bacillota bacterium]
MNRFLSALAGICSKHLLDTKVLVVPSRQAGIQAGEALARGGTPWVNLRTMTPEDLALEVIAGILKETGRRQATDTMCRSLMLKIILELSSSGRLAGFERLKAGPAVAEMVFRSIRDLSMAEVDPAIADTPVRDAAWLYSLGLESRRWVDYPSLLRWAADSCSTAGSVGAPRAVFMVPSSAAFKPLEWRLIRAVSGDRCLAIPSDEVHGLAVPPSRRHRPWPAESRAGSPSAAGSSPFSWLYAPDQAPAPGGSPGECVRLHLFSATGGANEVREVFRRIVSAGIPADSVEIVYTSGDVYVPLIYSLGKQYGLPVTFAGGVPVSLTGPGRALLGFIDWLSSDFSAAAFRRMIVSGDLVLPPSAGGGAPGAARLSRVLVEAAVGWGRERYTTGLVSLAERYDLDGSGAARRDAEAARYLAAVTGALIDAVPDLTGAVDVASIAGACKVFVESFSRGASEEDRESQLTLVREMEERASVTGIVLPARDALRYVRDWLLELTTAPSTPEAGRVHASHYGTGGVSGRPNTYVVGLDAGSFPGAGAQDPVLLDELRTVLSPQLSLSAESPAENTYSMASLLAGIRGNLTLSYSCYDVVDGRACAPAAVVLQAHRLKTRRHDDYTALTAAVQPPAGFEAAAAQVALNDAEWWLQSLTVDESFRRCTPRVAAAYPGIRRGLEAEEARNGDSVTEYEGWIDHPYDLGTAGGTRPAASATSIEDLARCPLAFFFKYVLRVRSPEELLYSPNRWLDPSSRGELLHRAFREVLEGIVLRGERVDRSKHHTEAVEVAKRLAEEYLARIPAPSRAVFEQERREIVSAMDVLLRMEEESSDESSPAHFELEFGSGRADVTPPCSADPVEITIEDGRAMAVRGRVDRVDRLVSAAPGEEYAVWDYKTGGSRRYGDNAPFGGGRRLQHAVYAVAVEKMLRASGRPRARVVRSGYLFPTERGEGRRLAYDAGNPAKLQGLLRAIADLLAAGAFTPTDDRDTCDHCDYAPVCDGTGAPEVVKRKMATSPILDPLRRLRSYD